LKKYVYIYHCYEENALKIKMKADGRYKRDRVCNIHQSLEDWLRFTYDHIDCQFKLFLDDADEDVL